MRFHSARRLVWMILALALAVIFSLPACDCGRRDKRQPFPNSPLEMVKGKDGKPLSAAGLLPKDLDPKTKEMCRETCKTICGRGNQCQVAGFDKPVKCFKVCGVMCTRGLLTEENRKCIAMDSNCEQVKQCLGTLTEAIRKAREQFMQGQAAPAAAPAVEAPSPPAPPAAAAPQ